MKTPVSLLSKLGACSEAVAYAETQPDLETAWLNCERGDWLLWFAAKRNVPRPQLVLAACACARQALPYTTDPRVLACIETTERWAHGEAALDDVRKARADAYAYAANAAYAAAAAAYAAAYSAYAAAAYAAAAERKWQADEIRKLVPNPWRKP